MGLRKISNMFRSLSRNETPVEENDSDIFYSNKSLAIFRSKNTSLSTKSVAITEQSFSDHSASFSEQSGHSSKHSTPDGCISFTNLRKVSQNPTTSFWVGRFGHNPVDIKLPNVYFKKNNTVLHEFENELTALSLINHPNIIQLIGSGVTDNYLPFLIFEHINTNTLANHIESSILHNIIRPYDEIQYLTMARDIIQALDYLHNKADDKFILIHRNISASNIGFNSYGTLKLMDFSLCACVPRPVAYPTTTTTTTAATTKHTEYTAHIECAAHTAHTPHTEVFDLAGSVGSLRYMAPEVAMNQPYNQSIDIYSFGVLLYEMIVGLRAYEGLEPDVFYREVIYGGSRPDLHTDYWGRPIINMSNDIRQLFQACWSPYINDRPSAGDVLACIERSLQRATNINNNLTLFNRLVSQFKA